MENRQQTRPSCCDRVDKFLFPHDTSAICRQGMFLGADAYSLYRTIAAVLAVGVQTTLMLYGPEIENFTYLTYWGFTATTAYFLVALIENIVCRVYGTTLNSWKIPHFFFPDVICIELVINSVFWLVFFPFSIKGNPNISSIDIAQAIGAHFLPMLMLLVDLSINTVCFWTIKRAATTLILMGCYLIVNVSYTLTIDVVYDILTYDNWLSYVFIVGCAAAVLIWYILLRIHSRYTKEQKLRKMLGLSEEQQASEKYKTAKDIKDVPATLSQHPIKQPQQLPSRLVCASGNTERLDSESRTLGGVVVARGSLMEDTRQQRS